MPDGSIRDLSGIIVDLPGDSLLPESLRRSDACPQNIADTTLSARFTFSVVRLLRHSIDPILKRPLLGSRPH